MYLFVYFKLNNTFYVETIAHGVCINLRFVDNYENNKLIHGNE